jgi:hypothetical protein
MNKLIFLALLLPIAFGLDCEGIDSKDVGSAIINYSISGVIELNFEDYTFSNLSYLFRGVPQVAIGEYFTNAIIANDSYGNIVMFFNYPSVTENLEWGFFSNLLVSSDNEVALVNPSFPYLEEFPNEVNEFLAFTKTANEDSRIKLKANEVVAGANDYFDAVGKIAEFAAYYIEYDLSYFYNISATASQVYDIKRGVCDEFATLAISLYRSVGIPARYVSGYIYTNIGNKGCRNFEPHAWVEVFIPGNGWISVDPTYKEFFWINAAHIPLYKNSDLLDLSSIQVQRIGSGGSEFIKNSDYIFAIELLDYGEIDSELEINIAAPSRIAEDSYLVMNVTINNPTNYWVLDTLISTQIKNIELINQHQSIPIRLAPMQSITKHFVFKLPDLGCATDCYTNAPFRFSLGGGEDATRQVTIDSSINKKISLDDVSWALLAEQNIVSPDLLVSNIRFNRDKYLEQNPVLSFTVKNIGNTLINATAIIEYSGKRYEETFSDLLINEQRAFEKELELPSSKGLINATITFEFLNNSIEKQASFIILKEPEYEILAMPAGDFGYIVELPSDSLPEGTIMAYINEKEISSKKINILNEYIFFEKDLKIGSNEIKFILDYSDRGEYYYKIITVGKDYSTDLFGSIARFFESIINVFKLLLFA